MMATTSTGGVSVAPPAPAAPDEKGADCSRTVFRSTLLLLVLYFGARLIYLALTISPAVPPDEITHAGIAEIFATVPFLPGNSPESYPLGLVTNIPWLYYWIMGKLLTANLFGVDSLVWLRLGNIPLALLHLWYVLRTLRLVTGNRLAQILLVAVMTNTMMLTFLSASVSYDNLANLLAAMSIYHLLAFFTGRSGTDLAVSLLCQLAGCLTKFTFLPLALALAVLLVVREGKNLGSLAGGIASFYRGSRKGPVLLTLALLLGFGLNLQLYGGNYLRYGKLVLETTDVLPLEQALQYRLAARGYIFGLFRDGKVTREEALAMTGRINHPGDRADAVFMIENYARFRDGRIPRLSLPEYIPLWVSRMAAGIFGVFGHLQILVGWPTLAPMALVAAAAAAGFVIRWRPGADNGLTGALAAVAAFYAGFLLYRVNYDAYLDNGAPFVALQGRYLFPVLGPIYLVGAHFLMRLSSRRPVRIGICATVSLFFILADFPLFLARITPLWTSWPPG